MKKFRDFESAREFVQSLNFKNSDDWREYCTSGKKPDDVPATPDRVYKNKGWISIGDFLGTGRTRVMKHLPFKAVSLGVALV